MSSSSKDINTFPLMHASIRRGLFMEKIGEALGENKDSLFITGAFSLLDKITYTSFDELFSMISVSPDIVESVTTSSGKYSKYLDLIISIEQSDVAKMSGLMSELMLSSAEVNAALLSGLSNADRIGDVM
jgi:EAL and modified HD-GYP domain-containing signal transduction protein